MSASMMAHLDQASKHGVDVIWWTEHDFRVEAHGYYTGIAFDGTPEGRGLTWETQRGGTLVDDLAEFIASPISPHESGKAMRVTATGTSKTWSGLGQHPHAGNSLFRTNLADTTLTIDVLAEKVSPDAVAVIEVETSYRPILPGHPAGTYVLQYVLGVKHDRRQDRPLHVRTERPAKVGWQTLHLAPLDDIREIWPDIVPQDSSLFDLRFGVQARHGATASAVFDHLTFTRTRTRAPLTWGLDLQKQLMSLYAVSYPSVVQYQSSEVSLVRHINVFMDELMLYPYKGPAEQDPSPEALTAMIRWYHDRGAVVQYNHPPPRTGAELVAHRGFGADLMEVGRDVATKLDSTGRKTTLGDRIDMYDAAARNLIFLTATGVTDDHEGRDWADLHGGRRYVTSVWAPSTSNADLRAALLAGRAWWHDLLYWPDATMDLQIGGRSVMGAVVQSAKSHVDVDIQVGALPRNATVQLVVGSSDRAAAEPSVRFAAKPAALFSAGPVRFRLRRDPASYLRVEVSDSADRIIGFSNPVWLVGRPPQVEVPPARHVDIG